MGSLMLPSAGLVYFDVNAFIYSVEKIEPWRGVLDPAWQAAKSGTIVLVGSEIVLLETLVLPIRKQDTLLENVYRDLFFDSEEVELFAISVPILERAARIRAETGLKTPDAIHAATALEIGAELFLTNDPGFRRVENLNVGVLAEFVPP